MGRLAAALIVAAALGSAVACAGPTIGPGRTPAATPFRVEQAPAPTVTPAGEQPTPLPPPVQEEALPATPAPPAGPAMPATIRPSNSPYGVNDWNFTDEAMLAMKEAGITWMRFLVNWRRIEAAQGAPVWNKGANDNIDFYISQAQKYGIQVSVAPYNAPDWAKPQGGRLPYPQAYANFVATLVDRYKGKIAAVEVLNEENNGTMDTRNRDARLYVPILQAAYRAVKKASPDTLVATSGMWSSPEGYLEDLYTLGAKGYFDVVNFHYYVGGRSPASSYTWWISHLRKVMEKYGDGTKPIWLTEFGWNITDEQQDAANIVSPKDQSDYMRYVLDASTKSGFVERVFWYELRNDDGMALMHSTNNYSWTTLQPRLKGGIQGGDTTLTIEGAWAKRWPKEGMLIINGERIAYSRLIEEFGNTVVQGLVRGTNGTRPSAHAPGAPVYNLDLTANFKRQAFYTYKDFIRAYPTWGPSNVAPLPDLPPPASRAIPITNPGFEEGRTGWGDRLNIDSKERKSGAASARVKNTTGKLERVWQGRLPVQPGASYFVRAWVKVDPSGTGNMNAMVMADLQDSGGKFLALVPGNYYIYDTGGVWREIHYPFRSSAQATQLVLYLATDKGTGVAWFDDISIDPYDLSTVP